MASENGEDLRIEGLTCTQVLKIKIGTESDIIDKQRKLKSGIIDFLANQKPIILSIVGRKYQLGSTFMDIAQLKNLKPDILDLDLFYLGEDLDAPETEVQRIFKNWTGTSVIFRMNNTVLREFRIGNQPVTNTLYAPSLSVLALLIFTNLFTYWYFS